MPLVCADTRCDKLLSPNILGDYFSLKQAVTRLSFRDVENIIETDKKPFLLVLPNKESEHVTVMDTYYNPVSPSSDIRRMANYLKKVCHQYVQTSEMMDASYMAEDHIEKRKLPVKPPESTVTPEIQEEPSMLEEPELPVESSENATPMSSVLAHLLQPPASPENTATSMVEEEPSSSSIAGKKRGNDGEEERAAAKVRNLSST